MGIRLLRQSTAVTVKITPIFGTDGLTPQNAVALPSRVTSNTATSGYLLTLNGVSTPLSAGAVSSWTALGIGAYSIGLTTADTATTGEMYFAVVNGSSFDFIEETWIVLPQPVFDGWFGATNGLPALPFAGSIDIATLSATLATLLVRGRLVSTGVTTPATADTWSTSGTYNGEAYYKSTTLGTAQYAWYNGSGWTISGGPPGTNGAAYWTTAGGATATGPYAAQGTASGTPTVTAHGNAILSGFQPDVSPLTSVAAIVSAIFQDLLSSSDFNTAGSFGAFVKACLATDGVHLSATQGAYAPLLASSYTAPDNTDIVSALADIAAVQTSVGAGLGTAVANVFNRIGAPATTSISADIQTRSTYAGGVVAGVANLSGMTLDGGTVSNSPAPTTTTFAATGLPTGLVTGDLNGQTLIFQTGSKAGVRRSIATHVVGGTTHTITLATAMGGPPSAADTFLVC